MGPFARHSPALRRAAPAAVVAVCALLILPATAGAQMFQFLGSFGSPLSSNGKFTDPESIATDAGGRVYVTDTSAGRVEIYDNAQHGNTFLGTLGVGTLTRPTGIAIDDRDHIYVADAGNDTITLYDSYSAGMPVIRQWGGTGQGIGQISNPRQITTDLLAPQVFAVERDNQRVQWWRPGGSNTESPVSAFGVVEQAEGIAVDSAGRVFVSNDSATDAAVDYYDSRGQPLGALAAQGTAPGAVKSPTGLVRDGSDRVIVVDAGNGRLEVFNPVALGGGFVEAFGKTGAGNGQFNDPTAAALAPGALLYVADKGNGRVVRLSYNDADGDGVNDDRDNCKGLANSDQQDTDHDGMGDACDPDIDNDGVPNAQDRCLLTHRGPDLNRDGCADPRSSFAVPRTGSAYAARLMPRVLSGTAAGDVVGVQVVRVAVARKAGGKCRWLHSSGRLSAPTSCMTPRFMRAKGATRWTLRVKLHGRGIWKALSRAEQNGGVKETAVTRQNTITFRVK